MSRDLIIGMIVLGAVALALLPSVPARADGGLILDDAQLWAMIEEGQQIAVVRLLPEDRAQTDLFISMNDRTGESHEVKFFLPLGAAASDFTVIEEGSRQFDGKLTESIEDQLHAEARRAAQYKDLVRASLLLGTTITNGAWTWAIVLPTIMAGCSAAAPMAAPAPVATYETQNSYIAIYDMTTETDLDALIATTGLDQTVKDTLVDLRGQQIAVITLNTQPPAEGAEWTPAYESKGQPGIHLSWKAGMVTHSPATFTYPLGTGRAWASPIELTRVYVVSPPDLDFSVQYPELGADLSGMTGGLVSRINWKIDEARSPAFAVDEVYGSFGHIWRGTYIKSNAGEDIVITRLPELTARAREAIRISRIRHFVSRTTWLIALLAGALSWVFAWWVVMPRAMRLPYRWREGRLYGDALSWAVLYPVLNLGIAMALGIAALVWTWLLYTILNRIEAGTSAADWLVALMVAVPLLIAALGVVNAWFYARSNAEKHSVTRIRAVGSYLLVILLANAVYFAFAGVYGTVVGAW